MRLPDAELARVDRRKITAYLLNPAHRYGASKARFLEAFGFQVERWEVFARALREHALRYEVARSQESEFGLRYDVDGPLEAPDGRWPRVRVVWQRDWLAPAPRLITAYPLEDEEHD